MADERTQRQKDEDEQTDRMEATIDRIEDKLDTALILIGDEGEDSGE